MHNEILRDMCVNFEIYNLNVRESLRCLTGIDGNYQKFLEIISWF